MHKIKVLFIGMILVISQFGFSQTDSIPKDTMLLGGFGFDAFKNTPFDEWFSKESKSYQVDKTTLDSIASDKWNNIEIIIFMGTWCSDSRREVPRFYDILNASKYPVNSVFIMGLDRKKRSTIYEDNIMNIELVPTIIIFRNTVEIGRIVETPTETLEKDLKKILETEE